jgi:hydroxymethylpyrimidine kinase/phosphomethylpyrimidine kinase
MTSLAVCSIGITDPWNAVGLGLDIRVLAECGVRPLSVVAGISAQDARGVHSLTPVDPVAIAAQWRSLAGAGIAALRIGALAGETTVRAVAQLARVADVPVVYDPVLEASRGGRFADAATLAAIRGTLLPAATVCTPNIAEAAELSGRATTSLDEMRAAARAIRGLGPDAVLVTGGHLDGDPTDVLIDAGGETTFSAERIATTMRGTGCVLAAALAAHLARGVPLREAIEAARNFVRTKIAGAVSACEMRLAY